MTSYPSVYVLILNYNGDGMIAECLDSLFESGYSDFKVVVIDNNSKDASMYMLKTRFKGRVIFIENGANLGYARGFNIGLKYAFESDNADYSLIMNFDTTIDKEAILELVKIAQQDEKIGFVTGKVYYYDMPNILQTVGKKEDPVRWNGGHIGNMEEDTGQYDKIGERYFADDVFILVSKKLYKETGGYDPIFFLQCEEYDWQARAKKLGYKIMYTPYAKLWHRGSAAIGKNSALKAYYDARNPMLVILLHKPPEFFKSYFWLHFRQDIFRGSLVSAKQGRIFNAFAKWAGLFSAIWWGTINKKLTKRHFI